MRGPFQWGSKGEMLTPEQVAARREQAAAMLADVGDTSPVDHWLQGAGRVVNAITGKVKERRADASEALGMAGADAYVANDPVLSALVGGRGAAPSVTASSAGVAPTFTPDPNAALAGDAMAALGQSTPATPEAIRAGLIARGLPEHVADGFVMNFRDESGLDPGINEIAPIVPGSRGGFGLYQLTGPRRRAYEAYVAERGLPVDSVDAQLDFLMMEMQGPESRAAQAILSTKDAGQAGAAIVNEFLRPLPEYAAKRAARYTGGQGYTGGGMSDAGAPVPISGGGANVTAALAAAMSDPWVAKKYGPVLEALMGQEMRRSDAQFQQQLAQSDPMYQAQLAQLTAPAPVDPFAGTQVINGQLVTMQNGQPTVLGDFNTPEPGFAMVPPEEVAALGLPEGAYQRGADGKISQIGGGGTNVTVDMGGDAGPYLYGTDAGLPAGWRIHTETGVASQIPGGPAALEAQSLADAGAASDGANQVATETITTAAQRARAAAGNRDLGNFGAGLAALNPYTDSAEVERQIDVLRSNAATSTLQAMRDASPTGSTGLGALTAPELKIIQDKAGALNQNSPNFLRDLEDYERTLLRTIHGPEAGDAMFEASRRAAGEPVDGAAPAPQAAPIAITTDAEYDALPPGTVFVGPDGITRRKP